MAYGPTKRTMSLPEWKDTQLELAQQRMNAARDSFAQTSTRDLEIVERVAFERWFDDYTSDRYPEYNEPLEDIREYQADQHRRRGNMEVTLGALYDAAWAAWKGRSAGASGVIQQTEVCDFPQ